MQYLQNDTMPRMTVDNKRIITNWGERYECYVKGSLRLGETPLSFREFQTNASPTVPPLVARVPDAPETPEQYFKCRACGKTWVLDETHTDPRRPNTRTCHDYFCDGTCDPIKSPPTQARPELAEGSPLVTAAPSTLEQTALLVAEQLEAWSKTAQTAFTNTGEREYYYTQNNYLALANKLRAAIKPPAPGDIAADEGSAR